MKILNPYERRQTLEAIDTANSLAYQRTAEELRQFELGGEIERERVREALRYAQRKALAE